MRIRLFLQLAPVIAVAVLCLSSPASAQVDFEALSAMEARSVGPSGQGGRINAVDVLVHDPDVIYVGAAAGGVWRSRNGGTTWEPIFDDQAVQSIGAIAVNQTNPDVIWVGTGEGSPRNSVNHGNGVYKSIDGGLTWTHLGLDGSRAIHRILLHPNDPDVAYLAVVGSPFGDSEQRGVYRTRDGGETWERTLFVDQRTGAADLVMDPRNPDKMIATMWSHRRQPWTFASGGPGSGLYVTYDAGDNWTQRTVEDGLPEGELGRIGVAIAASEPDIVYALAEASENVLLRSEDGARSFEKVNSEDGVNPRPFYYADIFVDPSNETRLYRVAGRIDVSEDSGETFDTWVSGEVVHVDHHAWWIHPDDPNFIVDGNDGGAAISRDRGRTWQVFHNIPIGQFYHVNVDNQTPYNIYGGAQDNDSFRGPAYAWNYQGIQNHQWENLGCCADGFDMAPDPRNDRFGYVMHQGGSLLRYDRNTSTFRRVVPSHPEEADLRFNWNAALALDPIRLGRVWFGSQFLHVSDDDGLTWRTASPDLTTNDPERQKQAESGGLTTDATGAENNTTIVAIAPSPVEDGVVWVGTDDGNVQLTRDGGSSWVNLIEKMPGAPSGAWVPQIHASTHSAGEAFVVIEDHRRDDWTPYVYHTEDFGDSWYRIAESVDGYALSVVQDPEVAELLFVGTDRGLWVSTDDAGSWQRWTNGVPATPVRDMVIQQREHDLVMGTFGRSFLVLDDIRPLRTLARHGSAPESLHVYPVIDAPQVEIAQQPGPIFPGDFLYQGENREFGARIRYWVPEESESIEEEGDEGESNEESEVTIQILSGSEVVRRLTGPSGPGLHQVEWGMERAGVRPANREEPGDPENAPEPGGPLLLPGDYAVRVILGADTAQSSVRVLPDHRISFDINTASAADQLNTRLLDAQRRTTDVADRIRSARTTITRVGDLLDEWDGEEQEADSLKEHGARVDEALEGMYESIVGESGQRRVNQPSIITSRLRSASSALSSGRWQESTQTALRALERVEQAVVKLESSANQWFETDWIEFRTAVEAFGLTLFGD